jgi:hypothetical protein
MQFPKVHSNGSDAGKLLSGFLDTAWVLGGAIDQLTNKCGPHPRDYYIQSTEAMQEASKEHTERLQALIKVRGELLTLADDVRRQMDKTEEDRKAYRDGRV